MAKSYCFIQRPLFPISIERSTFISHRPSLSVTVCSSSKCGPPSTSSYSPWHKDEVPQDSNKKNRRRFQRAPRPLITISTSGGKWCDKWSCDHVVSLKELQLGDLAEAGEDAEVLINLSVQKHAGFGFSIDGRIITSFSSRCSCCFSSYCRKIDTTFDVWVLPSHKSSAFRLPEVGGSDPSVIYIKPGMEADLDSLIQDTIRLMASAKDTCSETCEKSALVWQYTDGKNTQDGRWSRLLELKNSMQPKIF